MEDIQNKLVVVILGPTAIGKTSLAIDIAKYFNIEIISADSRQCFKELNVGVAKPTIEQLQSIPHYFISSHSILNHITVADFEQYAMSVVYKIFETRDMVVLSGGTGLYIQAFCQGIDYIPHVDTHIIATIQKQYQVHGLPWLQHEVREKDPLYWEQGEQKNPYRLMRALSVYIGTGKSILHFHKKEPIKRPFKICKIGLRTEKSILHDNIIKRTHAMMKEGFIEEAITLLPHEYLRSLQTVGYKDIFEYLHHRATYQTAVENIILHTKQYAKRQYTWFNKDKDIQWFDISEKDSYKKIIEVIEKQLK